MTSTLESPASDPSALQLSRRSLLLGAGFASCAGVAAAITPRRHEQTLGKTRLGDVIPQTAGPWGNVAGSQGVIVPEDAAPDSFYDQVLTRVFAAPNQPEIMLLIAYGAAQSGMMKVHRPEVCYTSAGFSIHFDEATTVNLGGPSHVAAKTFQARREDRNEQVLYWTRIGDVFPRSLDEQRLISLELGLRGIIPDGVLMRISTPGEQWARGSVAMHQFASALFTSAPPLGKALLGGPSLAKAAERAAA